MSSNNKISESSKIDERINPQSKKDAHIHYIVAFIGGFLGLFPILNVVHLFGSSQTSNLMEIVMGTINMEWKSVAFHLMGTVLYVLAVFLVTFLNHHSKINTKILSLIIDAIAGILMYFMPQDLPVTVYLFPTFFSMAFQWSAFSGAYGFVCSTIFSTNNLKQLVSSLTEVYCNGKNEFKLKAIFYGATLIGFHLGVTSSFILWKNLGNLSFCFVILPVSVAIFGILRGKNGN